MIAPCEDHIFSSCIFLDLVIIFSIIFLLLCLFGVYRMFKAYQKIKFENWVLLSGIIESIIFVIAIEIKNEYILQIIEFLQIIVVLFITRRFLKIYLILEKKKSNTKFYNYFFLFFVILNIIFITAMMALILYEWIMEPTFLDSRGNSYLKLSHNIFCFISSVILFSIGIRIKRMISKSLTDVLKNNNYNSDGAFKNEIEAENQVINLENDVTINLNNSLMSTNEDYKNLMSQSIDMIKPNVDGEIYFHVRITQVNIVTFSFLLCDAYELVFTLGTMFFMQDKFKMIGFRTVPLTEEGALFLFIHLLCVILPIFTNFIAFYYVIRRSFDDSNFNRMSSSNFSENDIKEYTPKSTKDIDQYLT